MVSINNNLERWPNLAERKGSKDEKAESCEFNSKRKKEHTQKRANAKYLSCNPSAVPMRILFFLEVFIFKFFWVYKSKQKKNICKA